MITNDILSRKNELKRITGLFKEKFGSLSESQINLKSNSNSWSIGQIIEHIIKTNETYYPILEQLENGTYKVPTIGKLKFITNFFGKLIHNTVEPLRKRKVKTFPIWQPSLSNIGIDIFKKFEKHQLEMESFLERCEKFIAKGAVISSPANRIIVYKLDKAIDIIIAHEQRHYNQAVETFDLLEKKNWN